MSLQGMPAEVLGSSLLGRPIGLRGFESKVHPGTYTSAFSLGHMPQWRSPQSLHLGAKSLISFAYTKWLGSFLEPAKA
jgi:hypothetical protein